MKKLLFIVAIWIISVNAQCNSYAVVDVSQPTGKINFTYVGSSYCTWIMDFSSETVPIKFFFTSSNLSVYDILYLDSSNEIVTTWGPNFQNVTVPAAVLYFSLSSSSGGSFVLNYEKLYSYVPQPFNCENSVILSGLTGTFGRNGYNVSENCGWTIVLPAGYSYFELQVEQLNIDYDYIYISEGLSDYGDQITYFNTYTYNYAAIFTPNNRPVHIYFYSDSFQTGTGFTIRYTARNGTSPISVTTGSSLTTNGNSNCGGYLYEPSGTISYMYYTNNEDCYWYISSGSDSVSISFSYFDTEQTFDYVSISDYNGNTVGTYSGYLSAFTVDVTHGRTVIVHFHSDGIQTGNGFVASYYSYSIEDSDFGGSGTTGRTSNTRIAGAIGAGVVGTLILVGAVAAIIVVVVKASKPKPVNVQPTVQNP